MAINLLKSSPDSPLKELKIHPTHLKNVDLNIGLFCLEESAPHWEIWQKNLKVALKAGKIWGSEQIAMNITIYSDNLAVEILPAYCNWILIDGLKFDEKRNTLVEPYLPNHEIGIVHFAGKNNDQIRNNKNNQDKFNNLFSLVTNNELCPTGIATFITTGPPKNRKEIQYNKKEVFRYFKVLYK